MNKKIIFILPQRKYISGDVPLGVCSLISYLKESFDNIEISLIDGNVIGSDLGVIESLLKDNFYDYAGVFFDTISFNHARDIIRLVKKYSKYVMAGGPHVTTLPMSLFQINELDIIIPGEAEYKLKAIIESNNYEDLYHIKDIYVKSGKIFKRNDEKPDQVDVLTLPMPDRSMIDMDFYIKKLIYFDAIDKDLRGTTLIASRGCFFSCTYCQPFLNNHFGTGVRYRKPEKVVDEIQYLINEYNVNAFFFHDDTLTANKEWLFKFCDLLIERKVNIYWGCNSRVDTFDDEIAEKISRSGLVKIHFGIESSSTRILDKIYKKKTNIEQIKKAVGIGKKYNITMLGFFMLGAPTETKHEMKNTINFARELDLNEATFSIYTPIPGTKLGDDCSFKIMQQKVIYENLNYYSNSSVNFGQVSTKYIRVLQIYALFRFYTHKKRLKYIFDHFKSFAGLRKLVIKLGRVIGR